MLKIKVENKNIKFKKSNYYDKNIKLWKIKMYKRLKDI